MRAHFKVRPAKRGCPLLSFRRAPKACIACHVHAGETGRHSNGMGSKGIFIRCYRPYGVVVHLKPYRGGLRQDMAIRDTPDTPAGRGCLVEVAGVPPRHPAGDAPAARNAGTPLHASGSPPDCRRLRLPASISAISTPALILSTKAKPPLAGALLWWRWWESNPRPRHAGWRLFTGLVRSWNLPAGNGRAARNVCPLISAAVRGRRGGLSGASVRQAEATLSEV